MMDVAATCTKNEDESPVVLTAVHELTEKEESLPDVSEDLQTKSSSEDPQYRDISEAENPQRESMAMETSSPAQIETFDTLESLKQAFSKRFGLAVAGSTPELEIDSEGKLETTDNRRESLDFSCETEDSWDYSSASEHRSLLNTVKTGHFLKTLQSTGRVEMDLSLQRHLQHTATILTLAELKNLHPTHSPTKGPSSGTMQSLGNKRAKEIWKNSYIPTRKDKRTTKDSKKAPRPNCRLKQKSKKSSTPLMEKSKIEAIGMTKAAAIEMTKAAGRNPPAEQISSRQGIQYRPYAKSHR
ncbi:hypothetical protein FQN60_005438 [Etheostoma spectabile]|uniref:Uncharacterized protein n=1 Tax=Etheostoma spectabile TaxID=54343 RepID=A0A5J5CFV7_9PERO|nr:hypothetical protein FQN60_005438 [Etheostoma spectabile]